MAGHVARMGEKRNVYRILVAESEGRRSVGRSRCRRMDNINMDFKGSRMCWYGPD
jgi:hypothetical protein